MEKKNNTQVEGSVINMNKGRKILTYDDLAKKLTETADTIQDDLNTMYETIQCLCVIDPTRKDFLHEMDGYLEDMNLAMDELHFAAGRYVAEG